MPRLLRGMPESTSIPTMMGSTLTSTSPKAPASCPSRAPRPLGALAAIPEASAEDEEFDVAAEAVDAAVVVVAVEVEVLFEAEEALLADDVRRPPMLMGLGMTVDWTRD